MKQHYFIGGASKCGTTAIYHYLRQHPEVVLPLMKELHYFSRNELSKRLSGPGDRYVLDEVPSSFSEYMGHYQKCLGNQISVDISPSYFFYPEAAERIKKQFPKAKIVFILRSPADKIFSQYHHLYSKARETLSFEEALGEEEMRKKLGYSDMWLYRESGFYADKVQNWITALGKNRVKVMFFEKFREAPRGFMQELCEFLEIRSDFEFSTESEVNISGIPRSNILARMLLRPNPLTKFLRRVLPNQFGKDFKLWLRNLNNGGRVTFDPSSKRELASCYVKDIEALEAILEKKTGWL